VRRIVVQIDALHEQRPTRLVERRQRAALERSMAQRPAAAPRARDEARLDAFLRGEGEQPCTRDR
jgi:hypothetical protein